MGQCTSADATVESNRWLQSPNAATALLHAVPHGVVSPFICPEVGAFLPVRCITMSTLRHARHCIDKLAVDRDVATHGNTLTKNDLRYAGQFPYLTELDMSHTHGKLHLPYLAKREPDALPHLRFLNLRCCFGLDAADFAALRHLTQVTHLEMNVSRAAVDAFRDVSKLTQLQHLDVGGSVGLNAECLKEIAVLSGLRLLNVKGCYGVDAVGLSHVAVGCTQLTMLDISWCGGVDVDGLAMVAHLKRLEDLRLSHCGKSVDASGFGHFATLPALSRLVFSDCDGVDAAGIAMLATVATLTHLDVHGCPLFDVAALRPVRHVENVRKLLLAWKA